MRNASLPNIFQYSERTLHICIDYFTFFYIRNARYFFHFTVTFEKLLYGNVLYKKKFIQILHIFSRFDHAQKRREFPSDFQCHDCNLYVWKTLTHTHTFKTINRHIHTKMCTHTPREHTLAEVAAHASRASLAATAVPLTRRDANRPATLRCDIHHGPAMRGAPPPGAQP